MIEQGAMHMRYDGRGHKMSQIIDRMVTQSPITLKLQREIDEGTPFWSTAAGIETTTIVEQKLQKRGEAIESLEKRVRELGSKLHSSPSTSDQLKRTLLKQRQEQEHLAAIQRGETSVLQARVAELQGMIDDGTIFPQEADSVAVLEDQHVWNRFFSA